MVKVSHKVNHWSSPLLHDYVGWNQSIDNYITKTCSMKFPENELIYIVQSEDSSNCVSKGILLVLKLSLTSKAKKIQMYSRSKTMSVALYLNCHWNMIPSSTFQCWTMEYHSKFNIMMLNNYFILKIPCQTHNLEIL
jgi:hypothetical protein